MRHGNTSGGYGMSGTLDPGASDSALATCSPHESVMRQCQLENKGLDVSPDVTKNREPVPDGPAYCRTGNENDVVEIGVGIEALKARVLELKKIRIGMATQIENHRAAYRALKGPSDAESAAHGTDKAAVRAKTMTFDDYEMKWVNSGRLQQARDMRRAFIEQVRLAKEGVADHKRFSQDQYLPVRDKYMFIAGDLMDRKHDCAAALAALR